MSSEWKEVTRGRYFDQLEILPPADQRDYGLLVGESSDHRMCKVKGTTSACYAAFANRNGRYFEGPHMTLDEFRELDPSKIG